MNLVLFSSEVAFVGEVIDSGIRDGDDSDWRRRDCRRGVDGNDCDGAGVDDTLKKNQKIRQSHY